MSALLLLVAASGGCILGALGVWFRLARRLADREARLVRAETELEAERRGRADDRLAAERLAVEQDRKISGSIEKMLVQVTNVTNEALKNREQELARRNVEQVDRLLSPLRLQLEAVQKATDAARKSNGELGVRLEDCFKTLQTTTSDVGRTARGFIEAVTGANKRQGVWGETILAQVLENCGLEEGVNYFLQTGNGENIPDCQVLDPIGRKVLIVDSKMSWTKYEQAYRLEDGPARRQALAEHVASVRRHVDELERAAYPAKPPLRDGYENLPLTAMFVPCDAAFEAAIAEDPGLFDYARRRSVVLVTPTTLFGFMQLVSRAWSKYNADKNADVIVAQAKLLVDRVDKLYAAFEDVGDQLEKAKVKQAAVMRLLGTGGTCIKGPALKIIKVGGKPEKGLKSSAMRTETEDAPSDSADLL